MLEVFPECITMERYMDFSSFSPFFKKIQKYLYVISLMQVYFDQNVL